jgi:hypothetical protein
MAIGIPLGVIVLAVGGFLIYRQVGSSRPGRSTFETVGS